MSFKDQLALDLSIFFNTDEFAEEIVYNTKVIKAIVKTVANLSIEGNNILERLNVLIKREDVANPVFGDSIVINSVIYTVENIIFGNMVVWKVTCRRSESVRFRS
jgi:hypothetical protein